VNAPRPEPYTSQSEALIDIEEWMGVFAIEHIIVNFDAYGHQIGKNMYAYKPQDGRWQLFLFDLDWLMLAAANRGGSYSPSSAALFNAEDPTIVRMYNHPPFRRRTFRGSDERGRSSLSDMHGDGRIVTILVANNITMYDGQALSNVQ